MNEMGVEERWLVGEEATYVLSQRYIWFKIWLMVELVFLFYTAWRHYTLSITLSQPPTYGNRKKLFSRILEYKKI